MYKTHFRGLIVFAVAMGFLEAIVVVYVRELYYPNGFEFPLKILPPWIIGVEFIREISTLLMLGSVAWISGKSFLQRLSIFLFIFGIWDIFYYIGLKMILGWPESLLTWDILFLIPITWIGPVLAPLICSIIMIEMGLLFDQFRISGKLVKLRRQEMSLLILGALVIIISFTWDIGKLIWEGDYLSHLLSLPKNSEFMSELTSYIPSHFQWAIFISGMVIILFGLILVIRRALKNKISEINR
jgi:hypothetical protein